jgi:hypothetical protein
MASYYRRVGAHRAGVPTVGIALTIVAAAMLLVRLPAALNGFDHAASAQVGRNAYGGATAAADSVEIDDGFVQAALTMIPRNGRFTVVLPSDKVAVEQQTGINAATFQALPAMMEDFLLPRRQVDSPAKGVYVLCYLCDRTHWDARTHWLYESPAVKGALVGQIN